MLYKTLVAIHDVSRHAFKAILKHLNVKLNWKLTKRAESQKHSWEQDLAKLSLLFYTYSLKVSRENTELWVYTSIIVLSVILNQWNTNVIILTPSGTPWPQPMACLWSTNSRSPTFLAQPETACPTLWPTWPKFTGNGNNFAQQLYLHKKWLLICLIYIVVHH